MSVGGARIPRTKGAKNKKTIAKERVSQEYAIIERPVDIIVKEEPKQRLALRLFTLEREVHDNFIHYISQFGSDNKLYESYIINEIMNKYVNGKIKFPKIDIDLMHDFMTAYGHVGFEPGVSNEFDEMDEFKHANRLMSRRSNNSFVHQYQYPIIVDPDIKTSMLAKGYSTSYIINELLKMYIDGNIKIDVRDFRIREWEPMYKSAIRRSKQKKDDV